MKGKLITISLFVCIAAYPQTNFDPDAYVKFLEENQSKTTNELLTENPPQSTYFSNRNNLTNVNDIPWFDSVHANFNLTGYEKELLAKNHFMVTQRLKYYSWTSALVSIYNNDLPLFLSSDFILYTLHSSYDKMLQTIEWQLLEPNLIELLEAMYSSYPTLYDKYKNDSVLSESLNDVDLYISVAKSLLLDDTYAPQEHGSEKYTEILTDVDAEQMASITLFTSERMRNIDFSQFKPRSHYTETIYTTNGERTLENYFKAMMWLGRIDFLLTAPPENPWEPDWKVDELRRMQTSAILLNELLYSCGRKYLLDLHEEIIEYFVGPDDNLTPDELSSLAIKMITSPAELVVTSTYQQFTDSLNASDDYGQKIMSNFFYVDPKSSDPGQLPVSFKLLGQKFLIDSYITSEVVYDRIIYNDNKVYRGLPDPLDIMSVFGNEDAMTLMGDEMETYHYAYKISALKKLVDSYDSTFWTQSLYNQWLSAIRDLNPDIIDTNLPWFMQTTAWHHEKLNTQLTSWAELRHDNILYAKQSYTGGTMCSFPYTFVEPYPEFFRHLKTFAENASAFFTEIPAFETFTSKEKIISFYTKYASIMGKLQIIAEKELSNTTLNNAEIAFLKKMISDYMASGPTITGWLNDLYFEPWSGLGSDFVVADIHTQPTNEAGNVVGNIYHVGNGPINMGMFFAPNPVNPSQLMAFAGPVSSFHYEVTKNFYRYTDEEWEEKFGLAETDLPPRPDWVSVYLASKEGTVLPEGRSLKGVTYQGTSIPSIEMNDLDYLLVFPNPANKTSNLRFILNSPQEIQVEIYNIEGKKTGFTYSKALPPGEHNITIDLQGYIQGLYMVKFTVGNKSYVRKITVSPVFRYATP